MTPVVITAYPDEPLIDIDRHPVMLDGPLSWAAAMRMHHRGEPCPPLTREHVPDLELPLARWHIEPTWGWCCSAATYETAARTATQLRRKPATAPMARYTTEKRHHLALGPHKARDTTVPATWARSLTWHANTTNQPLLEELLNLITHIGRNHAAGYGRIARWEVHPGTDENAWRNRPLPDPQGKPQGVRAPYHHPTRRFPCSWTPHA